MTAPAISVIIPAYNGAAVIGETLASLWAQSFSDFEVIVVDDRSSDDTVAVLQGVGDSRLRVIALPVNGGVVGARNRGMAEARGRYIAGLDQDDLCHPERFARQLSYLDAHPGTVLLGTAAGVLQDGALLSSSHAPLSRPVVIEWLLRIENPLVWSSVMIRADAARRLDPFNRPDLLYAEDFDLYHRIARLGDLARLDEELMTYRRHVGGASQRYVDAMTISASQVLAREYAPLFGEEATEVAGLIVRHVMRGLAVPDRETFERLGDILVRLQEDFIAARQPDADSLVLIRWETARRWARIARIGLRAGSLGLGDATTVRPDHLGLGYAGIEELVLSRLVGGVRSMQRRFARPAAG